MKRLFVCLLLPLLFSYQNLLAQCDFITPPAVKRVKYADRNFTFSNVTINKKSTTYLAVEKGEKVKITAYVSSKRAGNYCPGCIVQVYWGIRGYESTCAKRFHGYNFNRKKTKLKFDAPTEDGIYYITMGGSLEYSCKNNVNRPRCEAEYAIAVLKVGNPDPDKITLTKVKKVSGTFLKTNKINSGCWGEMDKIEWFKNGKKLTFDNQKTIPVSTFGTYKVVWSNCRGSVSESITHSAKRTVARKPKAKTNQGADLEELIRNSDKFVLENLIFDLGKSSIKPEAAKELNKLAKIMKANPSMRIRLAGHTDKRGSSRKNRILSEERVESAKAYLIRQGVRSVNIETKGWGDQKPLMVTKSVERGKINRRVEIEVLAR